MSSSYPEGNLRGNQPPLEFPLAFPCSGIVHHLSGPNRCARTRIIHTSSRSVSSAPPPRWISLVSFLVPHRFQNLPTRTHVRLLGSCFKTGRMESLETNTSSMQVHDGPPHGHVLHSSTATTTKQHVVSRLCFSPCCSMC